MKKIKLLSLLAMICLIFSAYSTKAQTLWGTFPDAFFHSSTTGDYGEVFKDVDFGEPGQKVFISPDNTVYSNSYSGSTIYRYRDGDLRPTLVFRSDSVSAFISFIDFDHDLIYGVGTVTSGPMIFRVKVDGSDFTILRSNDGSGSYGSSFSPMVKDGNKLFGVRDNGVFSMNLDGSNYQLIRTITDPAEKITKVFVRNSTELFALSAWGGSCGRGMLFTLAKDGTTFYKDIDFRGENNCGFPSPEEGGPEDPTDYAVSNGELPLNMIKDALDDDWFLITERGGHGDLHGDGRGILLMLGADGLHHLLDFGPDTRYPNETLVMSPAGDLYGIGGVADDYNGVIWKYAWSGEGLEVIYDFDIGSVASVIKTIELAPNGKLYGQSMWGTFNMQLYGTLFSINQDGTNPQRLVYFNPGQGPVDMAFGEGTLVGMFRTSSVNADGGDLGTIFTYSETGVNTIYDFADNIEHIEAGKGLLSVGNDGYAYVLVEQASPTDDHYMIRAKLDGTASQKTLLPGFQSSAALTSTSAGIFGSSYYDEANAGGFLFRVNNDFGGITPIYSFSSSTGHRPHGKVVEGSDLFLYGTTSEGGSSNLGVLYKIQPNGSGYTVIHHFTGSDGANPFGGLYVQGDYLYGLTSAGGANSAGTLFRIKDDGTGFLKLFDFGGANGTSPKGDLVGDFAGYLYGVTKTGGSNGHGVLFKTDTAGGFAVLKHFDRAPRNEHVTFATEPIGETSSLVSPADEAVNVPGSPEIKFSPVSYAVYYTLELSENSDFSGTLITKTINGTEGQIDGLSYSTTYYARVKTDATVGYGPVTTFTTSNVSSDAYVISPADSAIHVAISGLEVTANEVSGATFYTIELNTSADFTGTSLVQSSAVAGERTLTFNGLSNATTYYTRVQTDLSSTWGPTTQFMTVGAASYVISPANNATGVNYSTVIQFQPVAGATQYHLVLDFTRSDGSTGTQTLTTPSATTNFSGLAYSSVYEARVKTDVNPNFGPTTTFSTASSLVDTYVRVPANGATGIETTVVVQSNIVGEAMYYTIELNTSPDFTGTSIVQESDQPHIWYLTFTGLAPSTTYYSRVKTDLSPEWGATRSFTTTNQSAVTILDPVEDETGVSVTPLVKISPVPGATTYTLQLSEMPDYSGTVITLTSSSPDIRSTPLKYSRNYYARAKTNLHPGYGLTRHFSTHQADKYAFVSNPVDQATNVATNNLKVTANIVYGATTYRIELNTSQSFDGTSIVRTSTTSGQRTLTFNGLAPGTRYYSRVITNLQTLYGPVRSFTTAGLPTYVVEPANNATEVTPTQTIRVAAVTGATSYTLEVSNTSDFTGVVSSYTSTTTQFNIPTLSYSTRYYMRARVGTAGAFGLVTTFITHAAEKYSFVSSPVNGATNVGTSNVSITANIVYGATVYTIELNTSPDFTGTSIVRSSAVPNQRSIVFNTLQPGTTYYNRTMTNLPSGWGPVRSFTTAGSPPAPPPAFAREGSSVRVYPNPFITTFTTEVTDGSGANIAVFDITGRQVINSTELKGRSLELGGDLSQGVYILRIQEGTNVSIHRMIKQ